MLPISLKARPLRVAIATLIVVSCVGFGQARAEQNGSDEVIRVWAGDAPSVEQWSGEEIAIESQLPAGKVQIKKNVSVPTLTVFRPAKSKVNGTAMLVLPGGAFGALAWDLEGTEVAQWLADRGITAFVLKYRVRSWPLPPDFKPKSAADYLPIIEPGRKIAIVDAAEAMRLVRKRASEFWIQPDRIGMIGFSAGAATTMGVILGPDADARPNFAAPIYGMTMIESPVVPENAPPLFLAAAQDDSTVPGDRSLQIIDLWTKAKRPAELHLYEKGGHGFGMRPQNLPVDAWPIAFEAWLRAHGLIAPETGKKQR